VVGRRANNRLKLYRAAAGRTDGRTAISQHAAAFAFAMICNSKSRDRNRDSDFLRRKEGALPLHACTRARARARTRAVELKSGSPISALNVSMASRDVHVTCSYGKGSTRWSYSHVPSPSVSIRQQYPGLTSFREAVAGYFQRRGLLLRASWSDSARSVSMFTGLCLEPAAIGNFVTQVLGPAIKEKPETD